jgi:hypothetical protein
MMDGSQVLRAHSQLKLRPLSYCAGGRQAVTAVVNALKLRSDFLSARGLVHNCIASLILPGRRTGSNAKRSLRYTKLEKNNSCVFHFGTLFSQTLTKYLYSSRSQQLSFPVVQRAPKQTWRLDDATSAP